MMQHSDMYAPRLQAEFPWMAKEAIKAIATIGVVLLLDAWSAVCTNDAFSCGAFGLVILFTAINIYTSKTGTFFHPRQSNRKYSLPPTSRYLHWKYAPRSWGLRSFIKGGSSSPQAGACPFITDASYHQEMSQRCGAMYSIHPLPACHMPRPIAIVAYSDVTLVDDLERSGWLDTVLADIAMLWIQPPKPSTENERIVPPRYFRSEITPTPKASSHSPALYQLLSSQTSGDSSLIWKSFSTRMLKFKFYQIVTIMRQHVQSWKPGTSSNTKRYAAGVNPPTENSLSGLALASEVSVHLFCYLLLGSEMDARRLTMFTEIQHHCWNFVKACRGTDCPLDENAFADAMNNMEQAKSLVSRIVREIVKGVVVDEGLSGFSIIEQLIMEEIQRVKQDPTVPILETSNPLGSRWSCYDFRSVKAQKWDRFSLNQAQREAIIQAVSIKVMNLWIHISVFIASLSSFLYFLADNQQDYQRLKSEITEYFPHGRKLRFESVQQMIYLEAFIRETLNQAPPCSSACVKVLRHPFFSEQHGYHFPKGSILVSPTMLDTWKADCDAVMQKWLPGQNVFNPDRQIRFNSRKTIHVALQSSTLNAPLPKAPQVTETSAHASKHLISKSKSLFVFEPSRGSNIANMSRNRIETSAVARKGLECTPSSFDLDSGSDKGIGAFITNEKEESIVVTPDFDKDDDGIDTSFDQATGFASSESIFFDDLPKHRVSLGRADGARAISASQSVPVNIVAKNSFAYQIPQQGFSHFDILSSHMDGLASHRPHCSEYPGPQSSGPKPNRKDRNIQNSGLSETQDVTEILMKLFAVVVVRECSKLELMAEHAESVPFFFHHPTLRVHR